MRASTIRFSISAAVVLLSFLWWTGSARAWPLGEDFPYNAPTDADPNPNESDFSSNSVSYPGTGHVLNSLLLHGYSPEPATTGFAVPPDPGGGGSFSAMSFFDVFVDVTLDGNHYSANGVGHFSDNGADNLPSTSTFNTEMLQLDISGGGLPAGVEIRESPTLASPGTTMVTDIGGGQFRIDSFFDIFTELSIDGGQTWAPANGPLQEGSTPEPSSLALVAVGGSLLALTMRRRRGRIA
jgi:PEP-CTERM motif